MATPTLIVASSSGTTTNSYATASVSLKAGRLYVLIVSNVRSTSALVNTPTATGASQTWAQIDTQLSGSSNQQRITFFRCIPTSDASGALTIDFGGQNQSSCQWAVVEVTAVDRRGTNGANAVVQSATNSNTGTSISATLGAFSNPANPVLAALRLTAAASAVTDESGYTNISSESASGPWLEVEWLNGVDTTPSFSWTTSVASCMIAIEIKSMMPRNGYVNHQNPGIV